MINDVVKNYFSMNRFRFNPIIIYLLLMASELYK